MGANGKNGMNWIRQDLRLAIYLRDNHTCVFCLRTRDQCRMTLDHVVPRSQGGSNDSYNLVTACLDCNMAKGDKSLKHFVDTLWELRGKDVYFGILRKLKTKVDRHKARELLARRRLTQPG